MSSLEVGTLSSGSRAQKCGEQRRGKGRFQGRRTLPHRHASPTLRRRRAPGAGRGSASREMLWEQRPRKSLMGHRPGKSRGGRGSRWHVPPSRHPRGREGCRPSRRRQLAWGPPDGARRSAQGRGRGSVPQAPEQPPGEKPPCPGCAALPPLAESAGRFPEGRWPPPGGRGRRAVGSLD